MRDLARIFEVDDTDPVSVVTQLVDCYGLRVVRRRAVWCVCLPVFGWRRARPSAGGSSTSRSTAAPGRASTRLSSLPSRPRSSPAPSLERTASSHSDATPASTSSHRADRRTDGRGPEGRDGRERDTTKRGDVPAQTQATQGDQAREGREGRKLLMSRRTRARLRALNRQTRP